MANIQRREIDAIAMVRLLGALALLTVTTATNPAAKRFKEWRTANLGPAGQFKEWRRARFGNGFGGWAYWRCTGELSDPSTGAILARIEGVEATRDVGPAADTDLDYLVAPRAARVARRYAYGDAATGAEMESKALRPGGPARPVPRPAAYAADVSHGLLADGASVTLRAARGAGDVSPRAATFAATGGGERRVEAYVAADGSPAPPPSSRRFVGFGLGGGASKRLARAAGAQVPRVVRRRGPRALRAARRDLPAPRRVPGLGRAGQALRLRRDHDARVAPGPLPRRVRPHARPRGEARRGRRGPRH